MAVPPKRTASIRFAVALALCRATITAQATGCFSDQAFSWCNGYDEASCVHDYTFGVSHFQRKLDGYYSGGRGQCCSSVARGTASTFHFQVLLIFEGTTTTTSVRR